MEFDAFGAFLGPSAVVAIVFGAAILVLRYVLNAIRGNTGENEEGTVKNAKEVSEQQKRQSNQANVVPSSKKKKSSDSRPGRNDKQSFADKWLKTSLKGHTGQVLDMDYSNNGRFLASCSEEDETASSVSSASSLDSLKGSSVATDLADGDSNVSSIDDYQITMFEEFETCITERVPESVTAGKVALRSKQPLSRRQKKNRRKEENSGLILKGKRSQGGKISGSVGNRGESVRNEYGNWNDPDTNGQENCGNDTVGYLESFALKNFGDPEFYVVGNDGDISEDSFGDNRENLKNIRGNNWKDDMNDHMEINNYDMEINDYIDKKINNDKDTWISSDNEKNNSGNNIKNIGEGSETSGKDIKNHKNDIENYKNNIKHNKNDVENNKNDIKNNKNNKNNISINKNDKKDIKGDVENNCRNNMKNNKNITKMIKNDMGNIKNGTGNITNGSEKHMGDIKNKSDLKSTKNDQRNVKNDEKHIRNDSENNGVGKNTIKNIKTTKNNKNNTSKNGLKSTAKDSLKNTSKDKLKNCLKNSSKHNLKGEVSPFYEKLGVPDVDIATFLRSYLLSPEQMLVLGYPMDSSHYPGKAIIFKSNSECYRRKTKTHFDVNAKEFYPRSYKKVLIDDKDSGNSSESGLEDDDKPREIFSYDYNYNPIVERTEVISIYDQQDEMPDIKTCVRCGEEFHLDSEKSSYLTKEPCVYHWGKLTINPLGKSPNALRYQCCDGTEDSVGCTEGKLHVWLGVSPGINGPYMDYVKTKFRKNSRSFTNAGAYAIDCEMCYTANGLEVVKVTVVGLDGRLVYDTFVKPEREIIDYNSRFSGITAKDLKKKKSSLKTLKEVQNDLMGFISSDTILIGHGLENDLRVLKILHPTVVDTAVAFPHRNGLPYRRSLKQLVSYLLKREIQTSSEGHNSFEDARACIDLMLLRISKDFRSILRHSYDCLLV